MTGLEVHLRTTTLDGVDTARLAACASTLTAAERERADRFHAARDRTRFIVRRAFLRGVLGSRLGVEPDRVAIREGGGTRPRLDPVVHGADAPRFNLAHADGHALCGVCADRSVGVDIERVRPLPDLDAMMATVLSPREQAHARTVPSEAMVEWFFTMWTRKEALAKAEGSGISAGPSTIEVPAGPWVPSEVLVQGAWVLSPLVVAPGFAGCVAVERRPEESGADAFVDEIPAPDRVVRRFLRRRDIPR